MLDIPQEVKNEYYKDSVPKDLIIPFDDDLWDVSGVNWYIGNINESGYGSSITVESASTRLVWANLDPSTSDFTTYVNTEYLNQMKYIYVSFRITVSEYDVLPTSVKIGAVCTKKDGSTVEPKMYNYNLNNYIEDVTDENVGLRLYTYVDAKDIASINTLALSIYSPCVLSSFGISRIQIESSNTYYTIDELYNGALPYLGESIIRQGLNIYDYIKLGHPHIDDVTNANLIGNNLTLTESLCSQENLKFGVCEASYITFEIADRNDIFKNRTIRPNLKIPGVDSGFIPNYEQLNKINWFKASLSDVDPEEETLVTINRNTPWEYVLINNFRYVDLEPYLKYFDPYGYIYFRCQFKIEEITSDDPISYLRPGVSYVRTNSDTTWVTWVSNYDSVDINIAKTDWVTFIVKVNISSYRIRHFSDVYFRLDDVNHNALSTLYTLKVRFKEFQVGILKNFNEQILDFNKDTCYVYNNTINQYLYSVTPGLPLGIFKIVETKKTHIQDISKISITAYDNLIALEQNAYDWYTLYMYYVSMTSYTGYGAQFARQIFSSYWDLAVQLGLDSRNNHSETNILSKNESEMTPAPSDFNIHISEPVTAMYRQVDYCYVDINVTGYDNKVFAVNVKHDYVYGNLLSFGYAYAQSVDALFRGILNIAEVLVLQDKGNGFETTGFCVNTGDYFKLDDNCEKMRIYLPRRFIDPTDSSNIKMLLSSIDVYHSDYSFDLANASTRLVYYQYTRGGGEIFKADSSITGRDIIRSLLEVCGCFFRLDRKYSLPQFVYPQKSGLYPAEDLYPRQGYNQLLSMGKYITFNYEDYEVKNIGKIQIVKQTNSNEAKSICEWEYIGDRDNDNVYLIDDNIFYCNDAMEYDYDNMPEVAQMLENMYRRISHLSYIPHRTEAIGLPFIECGDRIGLLTKTGGIESFIWHRTLKGIQALRDTYEAEGDEYIEAIKDYGYKQYKEE